jgi:hypothetical protein
MAEGHRMTAAEVVDKLMSSEHADVIRESVRCMVAELMDAEVAATVGAEYGERAPERRAAQRNGYGNPAHVLSLERRLGPWHRAAEAQGGGAHDGRRRRQAGRVIRR